MSMAEGSPIQGAGKFSSLVAGGVGEWRRTTSGTAKHRVDTPRRCHSHDESFAGGDFSFAGGDEI